MIIRYLCKIINYEKFNHNYGDHYALCLFWKT